MHSSIYFWRLGRSISLALAFTFCLSACGTTGNLTFLSISEQPLSLQFSMPQKFAVDPYIRAALHESELVRLTGQVEQESPETDPSAEARKTLFVRVLEAEIEYTPFIYDRNIQYREVLWVVKIRAQLWDGENLIEQWDSRYTQSTSLPPTEYLREIWLDEHYPEVARWSFDRWLQDLRIKLYQTIP